ncbi:MAG: hypothetical protein RLZZ157_1793, partial [Pseudomonadota bacterium]
MGRKKLKRSGHSPLTLRDVRAGSFSYSLGVLLTQILVRDNNVDQALKALKKKMQREG